MTELLNRAFAAASALPESQQDEIARVLLNLAGIEQPAISLSPEEMADLAEAEAEAARGEVVSLEQAKALWAKHEF